MAGQGLLGRLTWATLHWIHIEMLLLSVLFVYSLARAVLVAIDETVILLTPPSSPLLEKVYPRERWCQQNDRTLADG